MNEILIDILTVLKKYLPSISQTVNSILQNLTLTPPASATRVYIKTSVDC